MKSKKIKEEEFELIKKKIRKILKKHKIKKAGIFGSYVRGEQKKNRDVDILIEPTKGMGFEFIGVKLELENDIKKKVDLIKYKGMRPLIKNQILKEEVKLI
jgi:predicted nucleotidyltransferase